MRARIILISLLLSISAQAEKVGMYSIRELRGFKPKCFTEQMRDLLLTQDPKASKGQCQSRIRSATIFYPDGFRHELDFTGPSGKSVNFEAVRLPLLKNTKCLARISVELETRRKACERVSLYSLQARKI